MQDTELKMRGMEDALQGNYDITDDCGVRTGTISEIMTEFASEQSSTFSGIYDKEIKHCIDAIKGMKQTIEASIKRHQVQTKLSGKDLNNLRKLIEEINDNVEWCEQEYNKIMSIIDQFKVNYQAQFDYIKISIIKYWNSFYPAFIKVNPVSIISKIINQDCLLHCYSIENPKREICSSLERLMDEIREYNNIVMDMLKEDENAPSNI